MTSKKKQHVVTWQDVDYLDQIKEAGGNGLIALSRCMEFGLPEADIKVTRFVIKAPPAPGQEYFVIVSALVGGEPCVGFGSGLDVTSALVSTTNRITNGSMKWRPDEYAKERVTPG